MAGTNFFGKSGLVSSTTSAKTILQVVAPSNHRVKAVGWSVSVSGVSVSQNPLLFELVQQSTAGSGSSPLTLVKIDSSQPETLQSTAIVNCTSEPTGSSVVASELVSAAAGGFATFFPMGKELWIAPGTRLGVRVTADTNTTVLATLYCEE